MTIITLRNGTVLDSIGSEPMRFAELANEHAQRLGLDDVRVFIATHPDGEQEYLIALHEMPHHASTSLEAVCCRLDMMKMAAR